MKVISIFSGLEGKSTQDLTDDEIQIAKHQWRILCLERDLAKSEQDLAATRKKWDERWYFLVPPRLHPRLRKRAEQRRLDRFFARLYAQIAQLENSGR